MPHLPGQTIDLGGAWFTDRIQEHVDAGEVIAWWRGDETSGSSTAADSSGNGHTASWEDAAGSASTGVRVAGPGDGVVGAEWAQETSVAGQLPDSDRVVVNTGSPSPFAPPNVYTVEAICRLHMDGPPAQGATATLFATSDFVDGVSVAVNPASVTAGTMSLGWNLGGSAGTLGASGTGPDYYILPLDTWVHIVLASPNDSTGDVLLVVQGVAQPTQGTNGDAGGTPTGIEMWELDSSDDAGTFEVCHTVLYNRALTEAEAHRHITPEFGGGWRVG